MRKLVLWALVTAFLINSTFAFGAEERFPRYIQKGDTGSDVLLLQQVLNADADTAIAGNGDGSKGKETDFYGELTKQAVIKLQKKHNLGTRYGFFTIYSGALDDKTREFLNGNDDVVADSCQRESGNIQQKIETAKNFLDPAHIASSSDKWKNLNELYKLSAAGSSSAPYIRNVEVSSKNESSFLPFAPAMTFKSGDEIKITGCNFATSTPNTINMTYGKEKATSTPDGTVITLKIKSPLQAMFNKEASGLEDDERDSTAAKMPNIPTFITVENSNGISNPYQIFFKIQ